MDCDGNLDMNDLIDFLKSLILTTTLIDKKYRETIPDVLSRLRQAMDSSDDGNAASSKRAKRKPRKMKPGKDGLFPLEEQEIRAWWRARQPPSEDNDHLSLSSPEAKALISGLRTRETQLQMVLMLEILALESLRSPDNDEESQLPGTEATDRGNAAKKKRDKHDLPTLLDVSADRLCIWQSTATEGVDLAESQRKLGLDTQESTAALQDPLRDFCVDIIMPL